MFHLWWCRIGHWNTVCMNMAVRLSVNSSHVEWCQSRLCQLKDSFIELWKRRFSSFSNPLFYATSSRVFDYFLHVWLQGWFESLTPVGQRFVGIQSQQYIDNIKSMSENLNSVYLHSAFSIFLFHFKKEKSRDYIWIKHSSRPLDNSSHPLAVSDI